MPLTNAFKEAVSLGNVRRVRIMMKDSLLNDPTFAEFNEMDNAARNLSGLYDAHDGRHLSDDKSIWNDSYMNELMVQIVGNFSQERVEHLKMVVMHLRPLLKNSVQQVQVNGSSSSERVATSGRDQRTGSRRGEKIAGGTIVGAVAGGVMAEAASVTVMVGVVIGAVIGAVVATVATKKA